MQGLSITNFSDPENKMPGQRNCHDTSVSVAMVSATTGAPAVDVCTTCSVHVHITSCSLSGSSASLQSVITTE
jgi:hypothetical protein